MSLTSSGHLDEESFFTGALPDDLLPSTTAAAAAAAGCVAVPDGSAAAAVRGLAQFLPNLHAFSFHEMELIVSKDGLDWRAGAPRLLRLTQLQELDLWGCDGVIPGALAAFTVLQVGLF